MCTIVAKSWGILEDGTSYLKMILNIFCDVTIKQKNLLCEKNLRILQKNNSKRANIKISSSANSSASANYYLY